MIWLLIIYIWKREEFVKEVSATDFQMFTSISRVTTGTEISNFLALITFSEFISEMGQESVWTWDKFLCNEGTAFCDLYRLSRWTSNSSYLGSWYMTFISWYWKTQLNIPNESRYICRKKRRSLK